MAKRRVFVVGVGMTKFMKPGPVKNYDYPEMIQEAVEKCLADAGLKYDCVEQANVGYVYGDSACGQKGLYQVGMTGIPITNVTNNCATGSTALFLSKQLVEAGAYDCSLAVGFEKMERGALMSKFGDRVEPMQRFVDILYEIAGIQAAPVTAQFFAAAGEEHMKRYGTREEHFAKISVKNHKHSINNPYSQTHEECTLEQVLESPRVFKMLTKQQCCPTSNGAGAALIVSEQFLEQHPHLKEKAVEILAMEMTTDKSSTFDEKDPIKLIGFDMVQEAAQRAYKRAGVAPEQIDVIELHDCFSVNELITYEALGLCPLGKGKELVDANDNTYGGKYVINPSGGLLSKGHPLGATGLAQCCELNWQLRNEADKRQVRGAKLALQHNIGLGGTAMVAIYKKYQPQDELRAKL
uniref:propanoyl-CoA C-acyltransferase n=1 Tax=Aceria tosichella TaxID=561515 RepID=A0A6G1SLQ4_9ACAR